MRTVCRQCRDYSEEILQLVKTLDFEEMQCRSTITEESFTVFIKSLPANAQIRVLITGYCPKLSAFDPFIFRDQRLRDLRVLDFRNCCKIQALAPSIQSLAHLEILDIENVDIRKIRDGFFRNFTRLAKFNACNCRNLFYLTPEILKVTSLVHFDITHCRVQGDFFNASICQLTNLEHLGIEMDHHYVGDSWMQQITGQLTALHTLRYTQTLEDDEYYSYQMHSLEQLTNLTALSIHNIDVDLIENGLKTLTNLTTLAVYPYQHLPAVVDCVSALSNLVSLTIDSRDGNGAVIPTSLSRLVDLKHIKLSTLNSSHMAQYMQMLPLLQNLESLSFDVSETRFELNPRITAKTLEFSGGQGQTLPCDIGQMTALTQLNIHECENLRELPTNIGTLTSLTTFTLTQCDNVKTIPRSFYHLTNLTRLEISGCEKLQLGRQVALLSNNLQHITLSTSQMGVYNHFFALAE